MDDLRRLHFIGIEMPFVVVGETAREDQQAVQRRAQFVRHVREELGLVLARARQCVGLRLGVAMKFLEHQFLLGERLAFLGQLLVGDLQLFGLQLQFLFGGSEPRRLFLDLRIFRLQRLVGGAQLFLLHAQRLLGRLQFIRLGLRLVEQTPRLQRALEVIQGQRGDRQQLVDQVSLGGIEGAE